MQVAAFVILIVLQGFILISLWTNPLPGGQTAGSAAAPRRPGPPRNIIPSPKGLSFTKNYGGNFDLCGFVSITTAGVLPPSFMPISMSWSRW